MKKGILLPLLLAVLAAIVYWVIVSSAERKMQASKTPRTVLVPIRDIKEREVIKRDYLKKVQIPSAYVQKDAFTWTTDSDFSKIDNAIARVQIPKGNQISKYAVTSLSPEAGLASKIPVQMRGFVMTVDSNIASMIKPDDKVDVLLTFEAIMKDGSHQRMNIILLQAITVLGVGSNLGQGLDLKTAAALRNQEEDAAAYTDTSALSLAVTPEDAQYLALAKDEGTLSVVLRSPGDVTRGVTEPKTLNGIWD